MNITPEQLQILFPRAVKWVEDMEREILEKGIPLNAGQMQDAKNAGVQNPEKVRLLYRKIPMPTDPELAIAANETNLISPTTGGSTFRYGIIIRPDCQADRGLLLHELTHTGQYERFGGIPEFLKPYIHECVTPPGYPNGPMEKEAISTAARLVGM